MRSPVQSVRAASAISFGASQDIGSRRGRPIVAARSDKDPANPLIRKLTSFLELSAEDITVLECMTSERVRRFEARHDIIVEGDTACDVKVILSGWACRYKQLADGRRQIVALLLPGDVCDHNLSIVPQMEHSIGTLTSVLISRFPTDRFEAIAGSQSRVARALRGEAFVSFAIQREWTVNLGQRDAFERVAHLLCEIFFRLKRVGRTRSNMCEFPITQTDIAYATGLSYVHVNRTVQQLRSSNLIHLSGKTLTLLDLDALISAALFNPNYLHLNDLGGSL